MLSYYESVVNVTPEGDSSVSEETLEGLGRGSSYSYSLLYSLFGSLVRAGFPAPPPPPPSCAQPAAPAPEPCEAAPDDAPEQMEAAAEAIGDAVVVVDAPPRHRRQLMTDDGHRGHGTAAVAAAAASAAAAAAASAAASSKRLVLTDYVPDPGYFLAGAIAGGVSRTATAPLDRLKVYLLVNTRMRRETAATTLKQGRPVAAALKNALLPFGDAVRDLYQSGGLRGFFAGEEASPVACCGGR